MAYSSQFEMYSEMIKFLSMTFVVSLLAYFAIWKYKRRNYEKMASKFPGPLALPIFGNVLQCIGTPEQVFENMVKLFYTYDSPIRFWLGPLLIIAVAKPEDVQIVLNSTNALEKHDIFRKFFKDTLGDGLVTAKVNKWRKHRRLIFPAFNTKFLSQFLPIFSKKNRELMENLRPLANTGKSFDLWPHIQLSFLSILCATMMGVDLDADDKGATEFADALVKSLLDSCERMYKVWLHNDIIYKLNNYLKGNNNISELVQKLPKEVIERRKKAYQKQKDGDSISEQGDVTSSNHRKTFLDLILDLNESGANFSVADTKDEVVTMMIGGSDTGAVAVSFTLLMLAMHPDIQEKVYKEVNSIINNTIDEDITAEHLNKMTYLEQCLKETMRLFPPFPVILRMAESDIQISNNLTIPSGANIIIGVYGTHRDTSQYPDPNTWNPDNFLPANQANRHKYSFIPFSAGPRGCIGSKYAMLSTKVAIATVISHYRLSSELKMDDIKFRVELAMRSVNGYPVKIYRRDIEKVYCDHERSR